MKLINKSGVAHWIFPAIAVLVIGGIGAYVLTSSKAASYAYQCAYLKIPYSVNRGAQIKAASTFKNTGTSSITSNNNRATLKLSSYSYSDPSPLRYVAPGSPSSFAIRPGTSLTFYHSTTAPSTPGTYYIQTFLSFPGTGGSCKKSIRVL